VDDNIGWGGHSTVNPRQTELVSSGIMKREREKKTLRKQINGKFNNIGSDDKNK
jgi:hypothetical protein